MALSPNNQFIVIPEFSLLKVLETGLKIIRDDYKKQIEQFNDEKLSYLYYLTESVGIQRLEMFKQVKSIFLADDPTDPKRITINLGYPQEIKGAVNLSIVHAAEKEATNAMSVDQSVEKLNERVYSSDVPVEDREINFYRETYARRFHNIYKVIITGDNTNEVVMVYNILKAFLISLMGTNHLNAGMKWDNVSITGNDLQINSDVTKPLFAKAINISFEYTFRVPSLKRSTFINNLIFQQVLLEK